MKLAFCYISLAICAFSELPPIEIPRTFGVNLHAMLDHTREFTLMKEAGFSIVRTDVFWDAIERSRGQYDFAQLDQLTKEITSHNLRPLFILSHTNKLYWEIAQPGDNTSVPTPGTNFPHSKESINAFAKFAAAAAQHFAEVNPIWEIWNEPDENSAQQYSELATATCNAIRMRDSKSTIIGPAAAKVPSSALRYPRFLTGVLASGIQNCVDGISIHPYLFVANLGETSSMWSYLRSLIKQHWASTDQPPPPVNSESGVSTFRGGISNETQASYLVRMMILDFVNRIPISIWYDWEDDGPDPNLAEDRFGIMTGNGHPKAAWHAMRAMTQVLKSSTNSCRIPDANVMEFLLWASGSDAAHLVVWTDPHAIEWKATNPSRIRITANIALTRGVDMLGDGISIKRDAGATTVEGGYEPFYLDVENNEHGRAHCPTESSRP